MKTFSLSLLLIASSLLASNAMAKGPLTARQMKQIASSPALQKKAKQKLAPQCTNFSGNWRGTCVDQDGDSESHSVVIQQEDCSEITVDGMFYNINGLVNVASMPSKELTDGFNFVGSIAYGWNDSQTQLRRLTSFSFISGALAGVLNASMWLAGDQLRIKDELGSPIYSIDGSQITGLILEDCTYTRATN